MSHDTPPTINRVELLLNRPVGPITTDLQDLIENGRPLAGLVKMYENKLPHQPEKAAEVLFAGFFESLRAQMYVYELEYEHQLRLDDPLLIESRLCADAISILAAHQGIGTERRVASPVSKSHRSTVTVDSYMASQLQTAKDTVVKNNNIPMSQILDAHCLAAYKKTADQLVTPTRPASSSDQAERKFIQTALSSKERLLVTGSALGLVAISAAAFAPAAAASEFKATQVDATIAQEVMTIMNNQPVIHIITKPGRTTASLSEEVRVSPINQSKHEATLTSLNETNVTKDSILAQVNISEPPVAPSPILVRVPHATATPSSPRINATPTTLASPVENSTDVLSPISSNKPAEIPEAAPAPIIIDVPSEGSTPADLNRTQASAPSTVEKNAAPAPVIEQVPNQQDAEQSRTSAAKEALPTDVEPAPIPTVTTPPVETTPNPVEAAPAGNEYILAAQNMTKQGGVWERRGIAMQFFIGHGLTPAQAAGFVGNLLGESTADMNPGQNQFGGPAFGIAQWEAGRLASLKQFAGDKYMDFHTQLEFIWHELTTSEGGALSAVTSTTTREQAAVAVRAMYERPSVHRDPERIAYANEVAAMYNTQLLAIRSAQSPQAESPATTTPERVGNVVYHYQGDPQYKDLDLGGGGTVFNSGCGPTSLAMIADTIGNHPGARTVYQTMINDHLFPNGGASQTGIEAEAVKFGLRTEYVKDYSAGAMKRVLDAGGLIMFSGATGSKLLINPGHFVVVRGIDSDGMMQVADPGNPANNDKTFSLQDEVNRSNQLQAQHPQGYPIGLHYGFIAFYPAN